MYWVLDYPSGYWIVSDLGPRVYGPYTSWRDADRVRNSMETKNGFRVLRDAATEQAFGEMVYE